jgi:DNA-directed RNA polymerase specialized sigma24 family protein
MGERGGSPGSTGSVAREGGSIAHAEFAALLAQAAVGLPQGRARLVASLRAPLRRELQALLQSANLITLAEAGALVRANWQQAATADEGERSLQAAPAAARALHRVHLEAGAAAMHELLVALVARHSRQERDPPPEALDDTAATLARVLDGLQVLEGIDAALADVARLRWLAGLSCEEIGHLVGVSEEAIARDWLRARAFLRVSGVARHLSTAAPAPATSPRKAKAGGGRGGRRKRA